MKKFWYVCGPTMLIMMVSAIVIGTITALFEYYKILSTDRCYFLMIALATPVAIYIAEGKYDTRKRLEAYGKRPQ